MTWINLRVFRRCHFAQSYILYIPLYALFTVIICINSLPPTWDPTRIILLHLRALQHRCNLTHITAGDKDPFMQSTGHELLASGKYIKASNLHRCMQFRCMNEQTKMSLHMIYYMFLLLVCAVVTTLTRAVNWFKIFTCQFQMSPSFCC